VIRLAAVAILGALLLASTAAAQTPSRVPVIGVLNSQPGSRMLSLLSSALREAGYEDGKNARVVVRAAEGKLDRLPALATELVAARPDVIVTINTPATRAAAQATREIPIVFFAVGDPVIIANLRPGGNVTGVTNLAADLVLKRLQLLREVVPSARRIATLYNPGDPVTKPQVPAVERALGAPLAGRLWEVRSSAAVASAFKELVAWRADAVFWLLGQHQGMMDETIKLATRHGLPCMVGAREDVDAGGLLSYNGDLDEMMRRAVASVAKILGGAKPGDLPIEQTTKFVLAVNLKTARALGLTVPPTILLRADHVVQ
jgi:putative tryptophan/tyrosine transport system substrate-binding protein